MPAKNQVLEALGRVIDPELGISIVELGLVYGVEVEGGKALVRMTFTTPACPMLHYIISNVEGEVKRVKGITEVEVSLVWDPPWTPERISEEGKKKLGLGP
jgi:metal-sulfur cluster biosynthetic enzyme